MHFVFSWSVCKTRLLLGKAGFADLIWSPKLVVKCFFCTFRLSVKTSLPLGKAGRPS